MGLIAILDVPNREFHYIGILANVDDSILDLELEHGFEVAKFTIEPRHDKSRFLSELLNINELELLEKLNNGSCVSLDYDFDRDFDEHVIYCIINSFKGDSAKIYNQKIFWGDARRKIVFHPSTDINNKENDLVYDYLHPLIKKMRLYKEGNICIPFNYCYFFDNDTPRLAVNIEYGSYIIDEKYSLEKSEMNNLHSYIKEIEIPINQNNLQLAFENFELSYEIQNINTQLLILINALEVLLKEGHAELKYRLSRNGAILLGKDEETSEQIFETLKCLYDIRSSIVHTGKPKKCKNSDETLEEQMNENINILRKYVRDSINEMYFIIKKEGKTKNEIIKMLNKCGFGERPWRNI